ncbi:STAS domain-containing protein [Pseudomonas sp.]|uniref:STAS domain-containing protein n=1 Tax=Pseudomonas sp. TaxID=306 RepID=UPI0028AD3944|nr:STAS domain-containing protein [Pseudomonas sp.]
MFQLTQDLDSQPACLRLAGSLTIYEVREAHAALLDVLQQPRDWQLDLAELDEIDSAGAQLLLAVQRHQRRAQLGLSVGEASESVIELFQLLRLQSLYPAAVAS